MCPDSGIASTCQVAARLLRLATALRVTATLPPSSCSRGLRSAALPDREQQFTAEELTMPRINRITRQEGMPRFELGHIVATPGAIETMERRSISPAQLLVRHV